MDLLCNPCDKCSSHDDFWHCSLHFERSHTDQHTFHFGMPSGLDSQDLADTRSACILCMGLPCGFLDSSIVLYDFLACTLH